MKSSITCTIGHFCKVNFFDQSLSSHQQHYPQYNMKLNSFFSNTMYSTCTNVVKFLLQTVWHTSHTELQFIFSRERSHSPVLFSLVKGSGSDPNKPLCRKAKELRRERKEQKLAQQAIETQVLIHVHVIL